MFLISCFLFLVGAFSFCAFREALRDLCGQKIIRAENESG